MVSVTSLICPENCNLMLNISFLVVLLERLLLIMATFYMRFPPDFHLLYLTLPYLPLLWPTPPLRPFVCCCAMHLLLGFAVPQSTNRLVNRRGMDGWNGGELTSSSSSSDSKWHKQFMHYPILFAGQSTKE